MRLAALVAPLLIASIFVTSYMFMKGVTFGVGFGFFGDPIISRGLDLLNRKFPNWQKLLELRNTILKGVPTNAQLTITLLRITSIHFSSGLSHDMDLPVFESVVSKLISKGTVCKESCFVWVSRKEWSPQPLRGTQIPPDCVVSTSGRDITVKYQVVLRVRKPLFHDDSVLIMPIWINPPESVP